MEMIVVLKSKTAQYVDDFFSQHQSQLLVCVYVIKWVLPCVRPRLEMYNKMAGFDADALAGLTLAQVPNPKSD